MVIPVLTTSDTGPNRIEYLLLLHISFCQNTTLESRIKALGGKYEHIKNIVQENSIAWRDNFLDFLDIEELFLITLHEDMYYHELYTHEQKYFYQNL